MNIATVVIVSISPPNKPKTVSKPWTEAHLIDVTLRIVPARYWAGFFSNQIEIECVNLSAKDKNAGVSIISKNGVSYKSLLEVWVFYKYAKLSFYKKG